ncbi:MAG TPA: DUF484 family protein [Burkholderiales bacterium]|jgi:uncharacterized protein YigA (DUF484 family)|nr:DUF484 family protein [Burkholderiales bacterium]
MKPEDVAIYLQDHPEFFDEHAEVLMAIQVPHPHGGRAIPLAERQIVSLREKTKMLEAKLRELVQFGEENDALGERVHRASLELIKAPHLEAMLGAIYYNLREDFSVPHVSMRMWSEAAHPSLAEFEPASPEARVFAESLHHPYCGGKPMFETGRWFGEAESIVKSFAYVPLRADNVFGLLILASEDPQRFYADMGTLYLKRLGELVSAGLSRYL